jgi:hypothetical protein
VLVGLLLPLLSVAQNQRSDGGQRHGQGYGTPYGRWEGRLSTEDQGRFDSYYSRWQDSRRTNNRDDIVSMENRMRDVMSHYNIPSDVSFGEIASNNNQSYGGYRRGDDSRWLDSRRTHNRDEIASMENRMRDVMAHNSIPSNTGFSQIASPSAGGYRRPNLPRFSGDDARRFRTYYSRCQEYRRANNRDEIASMEGRMRDVMNRHNIPNDVSYDEVMNMLNGHDRD